jgi:hypothetical protein
MRNMRIFTCLLSSLPQGASLLIAAIAGIATESP